MFLIIPGKNPHVQIVLLIIPGKKPDVQIVFLIIPGKKPHVHIVFLIIPGKKPHVQIVFLIIIGKKPYVQIVLFGVFTPPPLRVVPLQVSGSKFYYLKGAAALLEMALINWALQKVWRHGFISLDTRGVRFRLKVMISWSAWLVCCLLTWPYQ